MCRRETGQATTDDHHALAVRRTLHQSRSSLRLRSSPCRRRFDALGGTCHASRDDSSSRSSNLICLLDTEVGEDRAQAGVDRASRTSTVGDPLIVIAGRSLCEVERSPRLVPSFHRCASVRENLRVQALMAGSRLEMASRPTYPMASVVDLRTRRGDSASGGCPERRGHSRWTRSRRAEAAAREKISAGPFGFSSRRHDLREGTGLDAMLRAIPHRRCLGLLECSTPRKPSG